MNKWLTRAAIVTGSLGLIGAIIILINAFREREDEPIKDKEESKPRNFTDTSKINIVRNINLSDANNTTSITNDTSFNYINAVTKKSIKEPELVKGNNIRHAEITKPNIDTLIKKTRGKNIVSKKIYKEKHTVKRDLKKPQKQLSTAELKELGLAVNALKVRSGNRLNCVTLRFLENANNKLAARQVLNYLSRKKFAISGRETITSSRKGVYIKSNGSCITVTLGSL